MLEATALVLLLSGSMVGSLEGVGGDFVVSAISSVGSDDGFAAESFVRIASIVVFLLDGVMVVGSVGTLMLSDSAVSSVASP